MVVRDPSGELLWWTWAGAAANATVHAALAGMCDPLQRVDNLALRLRRDLGVQELRAAIDLACDRPLPPPAVTDEAVRGLKFAAALPTTLAAQTLGERLADPMGASAVLGEPGDHRTGQRLPEPTAVAVPAPNGKSEWTSTCRGRRCRWVAAAPPPARNPHRSLLTSG